MATIAQQLAEAEAAYHQLMTGKAVRVVVDQNGERIEYVQANVAKLAAYIDQLKRQNDAAHSVGPMRVWL